MKKDNPDQIFSCWGKCSRREGFSVSPVGADKLDPIFALSVHSTSLTKPFFPSFYLLSTVVGFFSLKYLVYRK